MVHFAESSTVICRGLFERTLVPSVVFIAVVFWPEEFCAGAVVHACVLATLVVFIAGAKFCRVFLHTFLASSIAAYTVYAVTAPVGDFSVASQAIGAASDSQFFLFEARRFVEEGSVDALFSTWGSLVPIVLGSVALVFFSDHYIGIVFFNSLLYSLSVLMSSKVLKLSDNASKFLPLFGWLPLQAFYNSMLSKEPIYIFLIVLAIYSIANASIRLTWYRSLIFFISLGVCMLLRPAAAIVLGFVGLVCLIAQSRIRALICFIFAYFFIVLGVILISDKMGFHLPINFSSEGIEQQQKLVESAAGERNLGSNVIWLLTPPFSIFFSPVLGVLWMVSPLPLVGSLVDQVYQGFSGAFTFSILATVIRYMDAALMLIFIFLTLIRQWHIRSGLSNPLILTVLILTLLTVMFQFLESGRHRYLPGFVLAMVVLGAVFSPKPQR